MNSAASCLGSISHCNLQLQLKSWRALRDSNPCFRRERGDMQAIPSDEGHLLSVEPYRHSHSCTTAQTSQQSCLRAWEQSTPSTMLEAEPTSLPSSWWQGYTGINRNR